FVSSLTCTTGSVLMARGRTNYLFYLGIVGVVLQVPAFIIGLKWGVEGVAAGHLVATVVTSVIAFSVVLRVLGRGTAQFLRALLTPMAFAAVMALVVVGCRSALPSSTAAVIELLVLGGIGAATYAALAFVFARGSLHEVSRFFRRRR
ncbi:MAG: polysaccharide biosynthesis C-terminal domain-containing protein, partial [Burkholderiales bacterium]|nr:polysaccharide biosynthesis C-terminal domain-containing protein [Burkholderiales bacterium]